MKLTELYRGEDRALVEPGSEAEDALRDLGFGPAEVGEDLEEVEPGSEAEDNLGEMTNDELRALLDERGIEWSQRDRKADLVKLVEESAGEEED